MATKWGPEQEIELTVQLQSLGPLDPLGQPSDTYDVTDRVESLSITRGRSDELSNFAAGTCTLTLQNGDRRFDPQLTRVVLHQPGTVAATASTPDHADLVVADLDVRFCGSLDDWSPGGFGAWLVGQWPNVAGNNGWVFGLTAAGLPTLSWSTNGTNTVTRTATTWPTWLNGSDHCLRATLDVDNGAGQHVVTFESSDDDGATWSVLSTVTTAGTTSVFNSTGVLRTGGDIALAGQVRWLDVRTRINGPRRAYPRFDREEPGTTSFTDDTGRVWTVNSTSTIGYDDDASPVASVLHPLRKLMVIARYGASLWWLYTGWVDEWPTSWGKSHGTVTITAYDFTSVIANVNLTDVGFTLDVDRLDQGYLGGDLGEQLTGDRVESLLSMAGFGPAQFRVIDRGTTLMPATDFRGDILTACQEAEKAEAGFFFIDGTGVIYFRDAHSRTENDRMAEVQLTLRDGDYMAADSNLSLRHVYNDVTFTRPGGEPQTSTDTASIARYGHRSKSETIEVVSDGEAYARAEFMKNRYGRPRVRPGVITVKPARSRRERLFDAVAGLDLLDRVALEQTPVGQGPTTRTVGLVDQVTHTITKDDWVSTIALSQVDVDDSPGYFTLDDDALGLLDGFPLVY